MAFPVTAGQGCSLVVTAFDGARQPVAADLDVLVTIRDGNQKQVYRRSTRGPAVELTGLPFFNNFGDNYTVIAWASGYEQAGLTPVKVSPAAPQQVDLMLLKKDATFNFSRARWDVLSPKLLGLLSAGAENEAAAQDRYSQLMEDRPAVLASLLNLTTAMTNIHLPSGCALDYFRELIWDDTMKQDRFFAYADGRLVDQVRRAAQQGLFAPEPGTALFHPGATCSFKQVQFGEANVQLTFHEEDTRAIGGVDCVKVEPDIDYYKDLAAHALLEVIANSFSGALSDPRQVYVLRWMAGRHAGVPDFEPPYVIA